MIALTHADSLMLKVDSFLMVATMLLLCLPPYLNGYWHCR